MNLRCIIGKPLLLLLALNLCCSVVTAESFILGTDISVQDGYMVVLGSGRASSAMESLIVDSSFVQVDNIRIGVSSLSQNMYFNFTYVNELGNNRSVGERLLEWNITNSGSESKQFTFTGNSSNDNMIYDLLVDNVIVKNNVGPHSFTYTPGNVNHRYLLVCAGYRPDVPYNGSSTYDGPSRTVNISWSRGNYSNQEIVVGNADDYPSSPTDGTVWQNSTFQWHNFTINETQYFTVFSWNETTGLYSSTGLDIPWGAIRMQCFNETALPDTVGINFDIQISNSDLTEVYAGSDLSNPTYLDVNDIPFGDSTLFSVSNSSGYADKQYTYDIEQNHFYNLSFWLPLEEPSGGGTPSEDDPTEYSENYVITVVGPQGEFGNDPPIEDATVEVKRYINESETYQDVGVYETDANGQFQISLIPGKTYYFEISKSGYDTEIANWVPPEIEFTDDRYHTFRLTPTSSGQQGQYDIFWEDITFTGTMEKHNGIDYLGNITITFSDSNLSTSNTQVKLMELFDEALTVIDWYNDTSNSWTYVFYGVNITRVYTAILWINNTANYEIEIPVSIIIINIEGYLPGATPFDLQERAESIVGNIPFLVIGAISAFVGIVFLCAFGPYNTSLGIVMCGVGMAIIQAVGSIWGNPLPNIVLAVIPFIVAIGIIHFYVKNPRDRT